MAVDLKNLVRAPSEEWKRLLNEYRSKTLDDINSRTAQFNERILKSFKINIPLTFETVITSNSPRFEAAITELPSEQLRSLRTKYVVCYSNSLLEKTSLFSMFTGKVLKEKKNIINTIKKFPEASTSIKYLDG